MLSPLSNDVHLHTLMEWEPFDDLNFGFQWVSRFSGINLRILFNAFVVDWLEQASIVRRVGHYMWPIIGHWDD